jgi:hypothetical protein
MLTNFFSLCLLYLDIPSITRDDWIFFEFLFCRNGSSNGLEIEFHWTDGVFVRYRGFHW